MITGTVTVKIQRDAGGAVAHQVPDRFYSDSRFHAACGERMAKRMKMNAVKTQIRGQPLDAILKGTGVGRAIPPAKHEIIGAGPLFQEYVFHLFFQHTDQGDIPLTTIAFRRRNEQLGFAASLVMSQSLKRMAYHNTAFL